RSKFFGRAPHSLDRFGLRPPKPWRRRVALSVPSPPCGPGFPLLSLTRASRPGSKITSGKLGSNRKNAKGAKRITATTQRRDDNATLFLNACITSRSRRVAASSRFNCIYFVLHAAAAISFQRKSPGSTPGLFCRTALRSLAFGRRILVTVCLGRFLLAFGHFHVHIGLVRVQTHHDLITFLDALVDDLLGHRILDELLDRTLQRSCTEFLIVAF